MAVVASTFRKQSLQSIDLTTPQEKLWQFGDPEIVWSTFGAKNLKPEVFREHIHAGVQARIANSQSATVDHQTDGRWLHFFPEYSMFEDVAVDETDGFFGSGDCPPSAFWAYLDDLVLVSFIPNRFVDVANVGVNLCVNDNVVWA